MNHDAVCEIANKCLQEIGFTQAKFFQKKDNVLALGMSSIEQLMFVTKLEQYLGGSVNIELLTEVNKVTLETLCSTIE